MNTTMTTNKPARQRHTPGGAGLGKEAGHEAQRLAAAILEVLAGVRTPAQAAEALGVSQARYFQIETRAMQALVASCAPRPRGPGRSADQELAALRRQHARLERELSRQQALVRLAQRTIGLAPPRAPVPKSGSKDKGKKRQRRPVVRALRAAELLQRRSQEAAGQEAQSQEAQSQEAQSQEAQSQEAAPAAATPPSHEEV
jgi:hypothetical protein